MNSIAALVNLDQRISSYYTSHNIPALRKFFSIITHAGDGIFWILLYPFVFIFFNQQVFHLIVTLVVAEIIGLVIIIILRYTTRRRRPSSDYTVFF